MRAVAAIEGAGLGAFIRASIAIGNVMFLNELFDFHSTLPFRPRADNR
jgi:hypothetical protein